MPELYLFGGPNGAGKTTLALRALPVLGCRHFVNADAIASGLSPLNSESVALKSGVLMMKRVRELREEGVDFASESTLSARAWAPLLRDCQARGYRFNLIYVWLPSAELAVERVAVRVRAGGHAIPVETIRRRYKVGLENFNQLYRPLADTWQIYDNSQHFFRLIADSKIDRTPQIFDEAAWRQITS